MYFVPESMFDGPQFVFSTGWIDALESTIGAFDVLCSRELVLSWSVNLFSTGWTDAPTEHAPVQWRKLGYCVKLNGYNLDTERPVESTPQPCHPSVLPVVSIFLQWTSNGYVTLSPLYKGTPGSFQLPLTPWIIEATLEKKRKCFEQKREDLVHCLCFNLEEFILRKCSKCAWARANWV